MDMALARKETNWRRKGFIEKLFTPMEQNVIRNAADPEFYVWLFWSMKEAAYKVYNRDTGIRAFMPKRLECLINSCRSGTYSGQVVCTGNTYLTQTTVEHEIIHTIALAQQYNNEKVAYIRGAVHRDDNGLPFIFDHKGNKIAVSRSHHGRCSKTVALALHIQQ